MHASTNGPGSPKACKSAAANSIISNDSEVNYAGGALEAVMERRHEFGEIGIIPKVWEGDSMLEDYCVFSQEPHYRATSKPRRRSTSCGRVKGALPYAPKDCPMPAGPCPFVLLQPHEICPEQDYDWTKTADPANESEEMKVHEKRNIMMMNALRAGQTIQYGSGGNSLWPWVHSGDCCVFETVQDRDKLTLHDVVFCQVWPSGRFNAHLIVGVIDICELRPYIMELATNPCFIIGNIKGHVNGSCYGDDIYGKLVEVIAPGANGWAVPDLAASAP